MKISTVILRIICIVLLLLTTTSMWAQSRRVTGRVNDDSGESLIGVSVIVTGTKKGVVTDVNGYFTISTLQGENQLDFSYVGMESKRISLDGRTVINVVMKSNTVVLDDIVAVGYGTMKKSDLTGSVTQVKMNDVSSRAINTVEQMLQGNASGVNITATSGAPGAGVNIRIRGVSSITGSGQPLFVVDGMPYDGSLPSVGGDSWANNSQPNFNPLANINPNDILSIEVLKDASSTAIYGSRGANGVILVTTKSGQTGKEKIQYSYRLDLSSLPKKLAVLSTSDYLAFTDEAAVNSNELPLYNQDVLNAVTGTNTNWQDLIYRTGVSHDHQLSISGGANKNTYSVMAGYTRQEGIVIDTDFERFTGRFNFRREVVSWFDFGLNISAAYSKNNAAIQSSTNGNPSGSVVTGALNFRPIISPNVDLSALGLQDQGNPLKVAELMQDDANATNLNGNFYSNLYFSKNLYWRFMSGITENRNNRLIYYPRGTFYGDSSNGRAQRMFQNNCYYTVENTLNYNKTINRRHRINAVGGFTWQQWYFNSDMTQASGFPNDILGYNNMNLATSVENPIISRTEASMTSVLGRVNYSYNDRYLVTFTSRADGSSRLAKNHKWGYFPSLGFGWNMHNETFLKNSKALSQLKLRASYGLSGNQNTAIGATVATLYNDIYVREPIGTGKIEPRFILGRFENSDLTWETTYQANAGFDLSFFNNRLRFVFDYYNKDTRDLLISLPLPSATGYSNYITNAGSVVNQGVEFSVEAQVLKGPLNWNITGNIAHNRNRVTSLGSASNLMGEKYFTDSNLALNQSAHITMVGYPIGSYFGYRTNGIYQTPEEVAAGPIDPINPKPGDIRFVNTTEGDNAITAEDRVIIGSPEPDFTFGLGNTFEYKHFSLYLFLQGSVGNEILNMNNYALGGLFSKTYYNILQEAWDNRWTGPGTSNKYPRAQSAGVGPYARRVTDLLVEDGSYMRIKTLSLSYRIPRKQLKNVCDLKFSLSATNLFTFTNYSGFDPEIGGRDGSNLTPGVDLGTIPQYRSFSFGVNVGL